MYEISDLILPYLFKNGDSIAAVDLLMDIEKLEKLHKYINIHNYDRILKYLIASVEYSSD